MTERKQADKMGNMETRQTKWEELSISNDFLFGKVMQNPELCRGVIAEDSPGFKNCTH